MTHQLLELWNDRRRQHVASSVDIPTAHTTARTARVSVPPPSSVNNVGDLLRFINQPSRWLPFPAYSAAAARRQAGDALNVRVARRGRTTTAA